MDKFSFVVQKLRDGAATSTNDAYVQFCTSVASIYDTVRFLVEQCSEIEIDVNQIWQTYALLNAQHSSDYFEVECKYAVLYDLARWINGWLRCKLSISWILKEDIVRDFQKEYANFKVAKQTSESMFNACAKILGAIKLSVLENVGLLVKCINSRIKSASYSDVDEDEDFQRITSISLILERFWCPTKIKDYMYLDNKKHAMGKLQDNVQNEMPNVAVAFLKSTLTCSKQIYLGEYIDNCAADMAALDGIFPNIAPVLKALDKKARKEEYAEEIKRIKRWLSDVLRCYFRLGWRFTTGFDLGAPMVRETVFVLTGAIKKIVSNNFKVDTVDKMEVLLEKHYPIFTMCLRNIREEANPIIYMALSRLLAGEHTPILLMTVSFALIVNEENSVWDAGLDKFKIEAVDILNSLKSKSKGMSTESYQSLVDLISTADDTPKRASKQTQKTAGVLATEISRGRKQNSRTGQTIQTCLSTTDTRFFGGTTTNEYSDYDDDDCSRAEGFDHTEQVRQSTFTRPSHKKRHSRHETVSSGESSSEDEGSSDEQAFDEDAFNEVFGGIALETMRDEIKRARIESMNVELLLHRK